MHGARPGGTADAFRDRFSSRQGIEQRHHEVRHAIASHGRKEEVLEVSSAPLHPLSLLLIEENPADAAALVALVSEWTAPPVTLRHAVNVDEAHRLLDVNAVDLNVLGLERGDTAELQLLQSLVARYPEIPLVVLTRLESEGVALAAIHSGAQDFVMKGSLSQGALIKTFRYAIERHQSQRELAALTRELQVANENLEKLSIIDPLTELLNRRGLQQVLSREVARMDQSGVGALVLLIDVDDFKRINDTLGHAAGDVALKEVARKIRSCVRGSDSVARIGGDEFMAILPKADPYEAVRIAERIRSSIAMVVLQTTTDPLHVTASIGAIMLSSDTPSTDELLMRTQQALARSKNSGKNKVSYAGAEFDDTAQRLAQQGDMVSSLSRGRRLFSAHQPILNLQTSEVIAYEYLSRYGEPAEAMPDNFFRLCAERNVLTLVDHQCMRSAIERSRDVPPSLGRHINLFPSTLLAIPTEHLLAELPPDVPTSSFCIEISESQIIGDPSYLIEPVRALKAAGVRIAMDDVGCGNSCLESLVYLEPDVIKLDKRCGRGIGTDPAKAEMLQRLFRIVANLTEHVVLEGIETELDLAVARDLGVRFGQGYLWGMPTTEAGRGRRSA